MTTSTDFKRETKGTGSLSTIGGTVHAKRSSVPTCQS
jgi:hypothetical protein